MDDMETNDTVRVLVVDDRPPFRSAARAVIELTDGFTFAGEAESGEDAIELAQRLHPALVLMDVNLPGIDGAEATRRIRAALPGTVVFLLSTYTSGDAPASVRDCGAAVYIRKETFSPDVLRTMWNRATPRAA